MRFVLEGQAVGTLHAMAPELLQSCGTGTDAARVDARAVDVYSYGVLLCAMWDRGRDPLRHIPEEEYKKFEHLQHGSDEEKVMFLLRRLMCVERCFPKDQPEGLRPPTPDDMPLFFIDLMERCWRRHPEDRPTFFSICEEFKLKCPKPPAPKAGPRAELRAIAVVRYQTAQSSAKKLVVHVEVTVEDRSAPFSAPFKLGSSGDVDGDGEAKIVFPFAVCKGEHVLFSIGNDLETPEDRRLPQTSDFDWVGFVRQPLPLPEIGADPISTKFELEPKWDTTAYPPNTSAAQVALQLNIRREKPSGVKEPRSLGVITVLLTAPNTLSRSYTPHRMPRELRSRFDVEYDVVISYRETETGKFGSNFVFRMQEALELKHLTVFCYANMFKADCWMSPLSNGIAACRVFMPILSPEYGNLDKAPWSAAELFHAVSRRGTKGGPAHILPVWYSGDCPPDGPNEDAAKLLPVSSFPYVPDRARFDNTPARNMRYKDVWLIVHDALKHLLD